MVIEMAARSTNVLVISPLYKEVNYITEIQPKLYWIQMTHGPDIISALIFILLY